MQRNINYCKNSQIKLGVCDNEIRSEKIEKLNSGKVRLFDYSELEAEIEWHKKHRNHLMGKGEKFGSKHKSEKIKNKYYGEAKKN